MRLRTWIVGAIVCSLAGGLSAQSVKKETDPLAPYSLHGFNVALVLGDLQGGSTLDTLPQGAKKAIADMREFLPYKSYRMLDSQWILCCGGTKVNQPSISGRLRGVDDQHYAFSIDVNGWSGPKLSLRFSLRDVLDPLKKTQTSKPAKDPEHIDDVQRQLEQMLRETKAKTAVIDSTFLMEVGETIVIGTSTLKGDKALVALLTAARRPGSQPSTTLGEKR